MPFNALEALAAAGNPVDLLDDEKKAALSELSEQEVQVLTSIQARLASVGGAEVEGQDVNIFRF
jgi:hypothetical protein